MLFLSISVACLYAYHAIAQAGLHFGILLERGGIGLVFLQPAEGDFGDGLGLAFWSVRFLDHLGRVIAGDRDLGSGGRRRRRDPLLRLRGIATGAEHHQGERHKPG